MGFFNWYEKHVVKGFIASAVVLYLQIPHTIYAFECTLNQYLLLYNVNPILNFFLYSIDLLEIIPIFGVTIGIVTLVKKRWRK